MDWCSLGSALASASFGAESGILGWVLDRGVGPCRVPPSDYNSAPRAPLPTRMSKAVPLSLCCPGPYQLTLEAKDFQPSFQDVSIPVHPQSSQVLCSARRR